ncbi:MAG: fumarate reductase subunit FrdD, partial [Phycisphaerae bacterium]
PIWWSLFSAGGVVAAFLIPVTIVVTGIAVPAGWISTDGLRELVGHPLARLYLFVLISLPMFHGAHRFRHVVAELGPERLGGILAVVCYGSAVVATVLAAYFLT